MININIALRRLLCTAGAVAISILLCSCSTPCYRTYYGPKQAKDKLASLSVSPDVVRVEMIDHKPILGLKGSSWDGSYDVEVLPGHHAITVSLLGWHRGLFHDKFQSEECAVLEFTAEAGHQYRVDWKVHEALLGSALIGVTDSDATWDAWIFDVATKQVLARVTGKR